MKILKNLTSNALPTLLLCGALVGCGDGFSDNFGFNKSSPDEFNVVTRPPLTLPPDYNLRPPSELNPRPAASTGSELAKLVAFGTGARPNQANASETDILDKASNGEVYGDGIREQLENERQGTNSESLATTQSLVTDAAQDAE